MKRLLLFLVYTVIVLEFKAQDKSVNKVSSISEIIFPASANIRNNFNLFYEIHLNRFEIPQPSFWYKVTFSKNCTFKFNLFPLIESDKYDFYLFKIAGNQPFCEALRGEKIEICYAERENRIYRDNEQSTEFRANLINVKPIEVMAGDAIYLEVFSVKGNDCGHVLDFQTNESSFVVKTINDYCGNGSKQLLIDTIANYPVIQKELAFSIFEELLCNQKKKLDYVSSIKLNNNKVEVKNNLELKAYAKIQPMVTIIPQKVTLNNVVSPIDSMEKIVLPLDIPIPSKRNKTTADLSAISDLNRKITRLEVDQVLFSLLHEDLDQKLALQKVMQRNVFYELKNTSKRKSEDRKILMDSIKIIKELKAELEYRRKEVEKKQKQISFLLTEQYAKNRVEDKEFVFNRGLDNGMVNNVIGFAKPIFVEGLVYRIQVGMYKNVISEEIFKGLSPIYGESFSGGVRYSVASFSRINDAKEAKNYVVDKGLIDAFVIAYFNGQKISIADAIKYESLIEKNN